MQYVSQHISYADSIRSDAAKRAGINNWFTPVQLERMKYLATRIYEPIVAHFGQKVYIASFFRSKAVNELIGGVADSQHLCNNGAAIDLDADVYGGISNEQVFNYIKDNLNFDQLIIEDLKPDGSIGWIHCSYKIKGNRKEVLTMVMKNGKKTYKQYKQ